MDGITMTSASAAAAAADTSSLLASLRAGDAAGYETLLREYGPRLLATARRLMNGNEDDARDVLQDAMVNCFKHIDGFAGNSSVYTWLHRIVVTSGLMKLRTRRRRNESAIEPLLPTYTEDGHRAGAAGERDWSESAADLAQRREMRDVVRACIEKLPENYRIVLTLRDIEELDTAETAKALGLNEGVVKTRLHRARQALRTLLEPHVLGRNSEQPRTGAPQS
jgi:RNA polymerase sigma-70 factor (ECF subfamily)